MTMKARTVRVDTCFPSPADVIWEKLRRIDTLRYIAAPYATFTPAGNAPLVWAEGNTAKFYLKLFGFIPLGLHTIRVKQFDENALVIFTNESNKSVPVWNHGIALQKTDDEGMTHYSDEIEISAGWKTAIAAIWCKLLEPV